MMELLELEIGKGWPTFMERRRKEAFAKMTKLMEFEMAPKRQRNAMSNEKNNERKASTSASDAELMRRK
jgi:hypothetical protein